MAEERKQIGAKVDPETYRQIRAQAVLRGRTVGDLIDEAIREWLDKHREKEMRRTR